MKRKILVVSILACVGSIGNAYAITDFVPNNSVAIGNGDTAVGRNDVAIGGDSFLGSSANGYDNVNIDGTLPNYDSQLTESENNGTDVAAQSTSNVGGNGSSGGSTPSSTVNPQGKTITSPTDNSQEATADGDGATVYYSGSSRGTGGTAIGGESQSNGGTAIGNDAIAGTSNNYSSSEPEFDTAINGSVFGSDAYDDTAIGGGSTIGSNNTAVGSARAYGDGSVAIGNEANAGENTPLQIAVDPSTAVGDEANAKNDSEAYGYKASATGQDSGAFGTDATASANNSVAVGSGSVAAGKQSGQGSTETIRGNTYNLAGGASTGEVSVGSKGNDRLIEYVAAGQISATSTQAVNGSELYATNQAINNLQATASSTGVLHYTTSSGATSTTPTSTASAGTSKTGPVTISNVGNGTVAQGSTTAANGNDVWEAEQGNAVHYLNSSGQQTETPTNQAELGSGSNAVTLHHVAPGAVTATSQQAVNGSQLYAAEGQAKAEANAAQSNAEAAAQQDANQAQANAEGYAGQVAAQDANQAQINSENYTNQVVRQDGIGSAAIGQGAKAQGNGLATGQDAQATNGAIAEGQGAYANADPSVAIGKEADASGAESVAVGPYSRATAYSSTALGDHADAAARNSTALGQDTTANGESSTAVGYGATANGANSAAIGSGSVANRPDSISVGNAATGLTRQITNVAPGTEPNDAVNLQQLQDGLAGAKASANAEADKVGSIDASIAGAAAEAAAGKHRNTIAGATADYNGQASFAFAYQHRFGTHWAALMSVASNGQASNTVVMGAGSYSW